MMILCQEIEFGYFGQPVLSNVTLSIKQAETLAILGRSGCGKTTLLHLLSGILHPTGGIIRFERPIHNGYAFAFQNPVFFPWLTVEQNIIHICLQNHVSPDPERFLKEFGLAGAESKYPWQLSGGMQRRLSIAMALSLQRPLLLLDEPGSGLDDWTKETLLDVLDITLEERKTTCVFTSHSLFDAVFLADRIILLGASPAKVLLEYQVNLPRPRLRMADAFSHLMHEVEQLRSAMSPYRVDP
ncbi:ABC transporter ATP-binding protein [Candidatus Methylomirabilis sp.]|uniref:ABC transporter ATP-binding protein n=1 Tax=Candidatus Methylomirabilis sp. TaxID=2032687 RepID=UPI0030762CBF